MKFHPPYANPKRASVLVFSVVVTVAIGAATISWLGFLSHAQHAARRDRSRVQAMNIAESGVEQVIDFFNNPGRFPGTVPTDYDTELKQSPYSVVYYYKGNNGKLQLKSAAKPGATSNEYALFEPYILDIRKNGEGIPVDEAGNVIVNTSGEFITGKKPVVTKSTYLRSQNDNTSSKIPSFTIDPAEVPSLELTDSTGTALGEVTDLIFLNPQDFTTYGDAAPPAGKRVVGKVIARGRSDLGVLTTVEQILTENHLLHIQSPGAIISHTDITFGAQFNVFWGAVMAENNVILNSVGNANAPNTTVKDPFLQIMAENWVKVGSDYANGKDKKGATSSAINSNQPHYYQPYLGSNNFKDYEHIRQKQTDLPIPRYDYDEWKKFFVSNDLPYYFSGPDGKIWGKEPDTTSDDYGKLVSKTWGQWFNTSATASDYWEFDKLFAFIDTIPTNDQGQTLVEDGVPVINHEYYPRKPGTTGAKMANISHSGGGDHSRGVMLVAANLSFSGSGSPPGYADLIGPDGNQYFETPLGVAAVKKDLTDLGTNGNIRISHNGILYTYGNINFTGNRIFYGSIVAENGYSGNGTPDVFYNHRLANGNFVNINQSYVRRDTWALRITDDLPQIGG